MNDNARLKSVYRRLAEFREEVADTAPDEMDCGELEERIQRLATEVGLELMHEVLERADAHSPTVRINGEQWGNRRRSKGTYTTIFGDVDLERSTYQRKGRGRLAVPLELRLGLVERRYTPRVGRIIGHSTGVMTAADAARFLKEVGVAQLSSSTIHRMAQAMAARHETVADDVTATVRHMDPVPDKTVAIQVALDGVMVGQDGEHCGRRGRKTDDPRPPRHRTRYEIGPILGPAATDDGTGRTWHEASVGTLAFIDEEGYVLRTTYLARMPEAGKATLVDELHDELQVAMAERPDLTVCFASDGAPYHWKVLAEMAAQLPDEASGDVYFLADFFHVAEYVSKAAGAIEGDGTPEAKVMASNWRETLKAFPDGAQRVLNSMRYHRDKLKGKPGRKEQLEASINYLATQLREERTSYADALERNLPIGTGITEAAAKTLVGVRMKRAGARYTQHGGQTVMLFRSAILSGRFDAMIRCLEQAYATPVDEAA